MFTAQAISSRPQAIPSTSPSALALITSCASGRTVTISAYRHA